MLDSFPKTTFFLNVWIHAQQRVPHFSIIASTPAPTPIPHTHTPRNIPRLTQLQGKLSKEANGSLTADPQSCQPTACVQVTGALPTCWGPDSAFRAAKQKSQEELIIDQIAADLTETPLDRCCAGPCVVSLPCHVYASVSPFSPHLPYRFLCQ